MRGSSKRRPAAERSARLLQQQIELGGQELFLNRLTREEVFTHTEATKSGTADTLALDSIEKVKSLPVLPASYEELRSAALSCDRCRLSESRTQAVFSDGAVDARLVVVGEAPGANEDRTGIPFVGAAGRYLDLLLATVGMSRKDSVYICNVLKCRPPDNRNPMPDAVSYTHLTLPTKA